MIPFLKNNYLSKYFVNASSYLLGFALECHWFFYLLCLQKQALVVDMMELIFCIIHKMILRSDMLCDVPVEQISISSACMLWYLNCSYKMYCFAFCCHFSSTKLQERALKIFSTTMPAQRLEFFHAGSSKWTTNPLLCFCDIVLLSFTRCCITFNFCFMWPWFYHVLVWFECCSVYTCDL